jgi:hypothetical protein
MAHLSARLDVTPLGDGTYEVVCTVEEGASRRFSFSQAEEKGVTLSHAPELGRMLAQFFLNELRKQLGDQLLRASTGSSVGGTRSAVAR